MSQNIKPDKKELIKQIKVALEFSNENTEIGAYVLEILDENELQNILAQLQKRRQNIVADNFDYLRQFKSEK